jgi:hypothetical protein
LRAIEIQLPLFSFESGALCDQRVIARTQRGKGETSLCVSERFAVGRATHDQPGPADGCARCVNHSAVERVAILRLHRRMPRQAKQQERERNKRNEFE